MSAWTFKRLGAFLCWALMAACQDPGPDWIEVAALPKVQQTPAAAPGAFLQHTQRLQAADWTPAPLPGVWMAALEVPGVGGTDASGSAHKLSAAAPETNSPALTFVPYAAELQTAGSFAPGTYTIAGGDVFLFDPDNRLRGQTLIYTATIKQPAPGRLALGNMFTDGYLLARGGALTMHLPEWHGAAELDVEVWAYGTNIRAATNTLSVRLDGREVFREDIVNDLVGPLSARKIALDLDGAHELVLENATGPALLALGTPRLARPEWKARPDKRPDLMLFVADTFRADNLAMNGGDPRWTPHMNAWAAEGLGFTNAVATAPWTLPSQASMLTGLYPYQHGATHLSTKLPTNLPTVAERLRASGYRTVAITDGLFLSPQYGVDRGFELFIEHGQEKAFDQTTLASLREVLQRDDGRPLFLFVQTYNVHTPYVVQPATLAAFPELFNPSVPPEHWEWESLAKRHPVAPEDMTLAQKHALGVELQPMYRGGVHDFDVWFGELLTTLRTVQRDNLVLILTSDHGEAFGEHGSLLHGDTVYQEEVHVPLVLRGPGLPAGLRTEPVGLIDLAPTLLELANVATPRDWVGRSLLNATRPAAPFGTFATSKENEERPFAVYFESHKVLGATRQGELTTIALEGFDLDSDPGELAPETLTPATSPLAKLGALIQWLTPRSVAEPIEASAEHRARLQAMGYFGDLEATPR